MLQKDYKYKKYLDEKYLKILLKKIALLEYELNSKFIIIIGEEEVKERFLTIKNNHTKEEEKVDFDYLVMYLDEKLNEECDCCHHE